MHILFTLPEEDLKIGIQMLLLKLSFDLFTKIVCYEVSRTYFISFKEHTFI